MTAHAAAENSALATPGRLRGLLDGVRELDDEAVRIEGELPAWLQGTLLLNGPARWTWPRGRFTHWFDGHAMLHRVAIGAGAGRYRSRFLRSADFLESEAAGAPAYGGFATRDPEPWWRRMMHFGKPRTTDNGAVVMGRIGSQWVAQTETPLLTRFDPHTLESQGRFEFDDDLVVQLTAAHSITEADGTYWNVGVELGPQCTYKLFCVRPGRRSRELVAQWKVQKSGYLHAIAMTPRHVIVWEPALRAQPLGFLFTGRSYIDNFRWSPEGGSRVTVIPREGDDVRSWTIPPMFAFHAIQAFEEGDAVVLDLCTARQDLIEALKLDKLRSAAPLAIPHEALRYRLEPGRSDSQPTSLGRGFDLPMVHGDWWTRRRARLAWAAGFDPEQRAPFLDRTVKVDLDQARIVASWQRPDAVHLEPLFVAKPAAETEEDGVLLVPTLSDTDAGTVVGVVDPATMKLLASLHLPQVVPFGFHAAWQGAGA